MAKKIIGQCHLCLNTLELSFEHIPPKSTNNKLPVKKYTGASIEKLLQGGSLENERYENLQQGSGDYTLCKHCNNWTGSKYADDYVQFINALLEVYLVNKDKNYTNITMKVEKINALNILKQISCMFLSINPICSALEELRRFVIDEKSMTFPKNYKIYMFYNGGNIKRATPFEMEYDFDKKIGYCFSEIIHFPISFLLIENKVDLSVTGKEISTLFLHPSNEYYLDIPILYPTERPLDYNVQKENNNG